MKVFVERGGKRYEIVKCGMRCSFARKDADPNPCCECIPLWHQTHCAKNCYLPKWWLNARSFVDGGLREIRTKTCDYCGNWHNGCDYGYLKHEQDECGHFKAVTK